MATQTSDSPTRGYSATKDQLLKRLRRVGTTAELMTAVGRLMRRGGSAETNRRRTGSATPDSATRPMDHAHRDRRV